MKIIFGETPEYFRSTKASDGNDLYVYTAFGKPLNVKLEHLKSNRFSASRFDPREGTFEKISAPDNGKSDEIMFFMPPSSGRFHDWVLVLDAL